MGEDTPFAEAAARVAGGADHRAEARVLVQRMTRDEKLDCLDGDTDFGFDALVGDYFKRPFPAAAVERLGIPGIQFTDGPRGCVIAPATAFPVSMARGATFDPDLEERIGEAIGAESRARGATFSGAVCMNLLHHLAWGRAQETYGEDPHHIGEMAAAFARGLQRHVLACMKHFACNSMENARFAVDVTCDERPLHEVYLAHFRRVADEGVASTMSAYNSLNGTWCGDNTALLTDILRTEWGWDGFVITDFVFGLRDPVGSVAAGCDIEMPFRQQRADCLAAALEDGELREADVDAAVTNIVATLLRFADRIERTVDASVIECDAHRALAYEASVASTVLLRNNGLLPVEPSSSRRVAVLGRLAAVANLGDHGSSTVRPTSTVTPLDGLRTVFTDASVEHHDTDAAIAEGADLVVVVVGTTFADEGEYLGAISKATLALIPALRDPGRDSRAARAGAGDPEAPPPAPPSAPPPAPPSAPPSGDVDTPSDSGGAMGISGAQGGDRRSLLVSSEDQALIAEATVRNDRVVVVVMGGSGFVMPWLETVPATLQIWYPGLEGGTALADMMAGDAEPAGRLPFAMPHDEADLVDFDPDATEVTYGLFHGQWFLDRNGVEPARPFGFGLGYTTFELEADLSEGLRTGNVTVTATNTGTRVGSTVIQVYGSVVGSGYERPARRLIGFRRVYANPGESRTVDVSLDLHVLDIRDRGTWLTEPGTYRIEIGQSAADLPLRSETSIDDPWW
ncbi:MAG TPA: glycoside hydrolase family 3 N-terminal domain-containing protein [Acidimicrobiia bacterium]|nr:glycoside hydrolase family 3 N-terminal domain-containing protein [Acidimicrobiia bacterium]